MYLDSAILVKLVVREPDSRHLAGLVDLQRAAVASELAVVECDSALIRKVRERQLDDPTREAAWNRLREYWTQGAIRLLPVTLPILNRACAFLDRCGAAIPLRTLDAIHLATAWEHRAFPLLTTDRVMLRAAARLRIPLLPEADGESEKH